MIAFDPTAVELAKKDGLHMFRFELVGKHANKGTVASSGAIGPKTVKKFWAFYRKHLQLDSMAMK